MIFYARFCFLFSKTKGGIYGLEMMDFWFEQKKNWSYFLRFNRVKYRLHNRNFWIDCRKRKRQAEKESRLWFDRCPLRTELNEINFWINQKVKLVLRSFLFNELLVFNSFHWLVFNRFWLSEIETEKRPL